MKTKWREDDVVMIGGDMVIILHVLDGEYIVRIVDTGEEVTVSAEGDREWPVK